MIDRNDIPYRKTFPPKSTKQLGQGGPRDMQRRMNIGSANINMPKIDMEALKEVVLTNKEVREELKSDIRKEMNEVKEALFSNNLLDGVGLPFDVVEKKIKEAVEYNEKQVVSRYESGLNSLNSQLNASKDQIKDLNSQIDAYKNEILLLKKELVDKEFIVNDLRDKGNKEAIELKNTVVELIDKIKTGKITQYNYIEESRPILDDKVFIDPLGETPTDLESHIDVSASEAAGHKVDLKNDVAKLKTLLGKAVIKLN